MRLASFFATASMKAIRCSAIVLSGLLALSPFVQVSASAAPVTEAVKAAVAKPKAAKQAKAKPKTTKAASKTAERKQSDVVAAPLPKVKMDLSLPKDMVRELDPPASVVAAPKGQKPLLPALFEQKEQDDFQLGGRLLSNEMNLQMRNQRDVHEIEGAALDFKFKQ